MKTVTECLLVVLGSSLVREEAPLDGMPIPHAKAEKRLLCA